MKKISIIRVLLMVISFMLIFTINIEISAGQAETIFATDFTSAAVSEGYSEKAFSINDTVSNSSVEWNCSIGQISTSSNITTLYFGPNDTNNKNSITNIYLKGRPNYSGILAELNKTSSFNEDSLAFALMTTSTLSLENVGEVTFNWKGSGWKKDETADYDIYFLGKIDNAWNLISFQTIPITGGSSTAGFHKVSGCNFDLTGLAFVVQPQNPGTNDSDGKGEVNNLRPTTLVIKSATSIDKLQGIQTSASVKFNYQATESDATYVSGTAALRFGTVLEVDLLEEIATELGTTIDNLSYGIEYKTETSELKTKPLTPARVDSPNSTEENETGDYLQVALLLTQIPDDDLDVSVTAKLYIEYDGTKHYMQETTHSFKSVIEKLWDDDDFMEELEGINENVCYAIMDLIDNYLE